MVEEVLTIYGGVDEEGDELGDAWQWYHGNGWLQIKILNSEATGSVRRSVDDSSMAKIRQGIHTNLQDYHIEGTLVDSHILKPHARYRHCSWSSSCGSMMFIHGGMTTERLSDDPRLRTAIRVLTHDNAIWRLKVFIPLFFVHQ